MVVLNSSKEKSFNKLTKLLRSFEGVSETLQKRLKSSRFFLKVIIVAFDFSEKKNSEKLVFEKKNCFPNFHLGFFIVCCLILPNLTAEESICNNIWFNFCFYCRIRNLYFFSRRLIYFFLFFFSFLALFKWDSAMIFS